VLAGRRQVSARLQNKRKEYLRHLRVLNASFFEWLQRHVKEAPQLNLADAAQDYVDYSSQLQDRYLKEYGEVFTFGSGDCGQLAHGTENDEDLMVKYPRVVYSLRSDSFEFISPHRML
jgi:regulator of chromosome condensation